MTPDQFSADPFGGQPDPATTLAARLREIQPGFDGCVAGHRLALEAAAALESLQDALAAREREHSESERQLREWIDKYAQAEARAEAARKCIEAADTMLKYTTVATGDPQARAAVSAYDTARATLRELERKP